MIFKVILHNAKHGDNKAKEEILRMYQPLLFKESILNGTFDEDLYQELCIKLIECIDKFVM